MFTIALMFRGERVDHDDVDDSHVNEDLGNLGDDHVDGDGVDDGATGAVNDLRGGHFVGDEIGVGEADVGDGVGGLGGADVIGRDDANDADVGGGVDNLNDGHGDDDVDRGGVGDDVGNLSDGHVGDECDCVDGIGNDHVKR